MGTGKWSSILKTFDRIHGGFCKALPWCFDVGNNMIQDPWGILDLMFGYAVAVYIAYSCWLGWNFGSESWITRMMMMMMMMMMMLVVVMMMMMMMVVVVVGRKRFATEQEKILSLAATDEDMSLSRRNRLTCRGISQCERLVQQKDGAKMGRKMGL